MSKQSELPALLVVEDQEKGGPNEIVTFTTGYRAKIKPVSARLLDDVISRIPEPPIPEVYMDDKGRNEPNPLDPLYLQAKEKAEHDRSMASVDVMILMGVTLVDPVPAEEEWLYPLQDLERLGLMDLSKFDLSKQRDREFLFKRFVAVGNEDMSLITKKMGISEEQIKNAEAAFQGDKVRGGNQGLSPESEVSG